MTRLVLHRHSAPLIRDADFHPEYRSPMRAVFGEMMERYPQAKLRAVRGFDGKPGDRSLGIADKGCIWLNRYWFARPLRALQLAGASGRMLRGAPGVAAWHDDMDEPRHVLVHEFGHLLADATPGAEDFAEAGWRQATKRPELAASGYSLVDSAEWLAETFAALHCSPDRGPQVRALQEFLGG